MNNEKKLKTKLGIYIKITVTYILFMCRIDRVLDFIFHYLQVSIATNYRD